MLDQHRPIVTIARPLTTMERSWISQRLEVVAPWADAGPDPATSIAIVVKTLLAYAMGNLTDAQLEARTEAFDLAVQDLPSWAVEEGRKRWLRGETGDLSNVNLSFPPAPGQLRHLALAALTPIRGEAFRLRRLLAANAIEHEPPTPKNVEKVRELAAQVAGRATELAKPKAQRLSQHEADMIERIRRTGELPGDEEIEQVAAHVHRTPGHA